MSIPIQTGGYSCQVCGAFIPHGTIHFCAGAPSPSNIPFFRYSGVTQVGWECPRCHTIHAPWVSACWCPAPTELTTDTGPRAPTDQGGDPT